MANPADDAAIEDAKFKAEMARTDAANTMTTLTEQSGQFVAGAAQALSKGMVSLAMSGNTGFTDSAAPIMAGAVGSQDPTKLVKMRDDAAALQASLASTPSTIAQTVYQSTGPGEGEEVTTSVANPEYARIQAELQTAQDNLAVLDVVAPGSGPKIQDPSMLLRASGSDLLTMMNTREMMQKDLNTYVRSQKGAAITMLENAGNYDLAAEYAQETKDYNTLNTVLGYGFKIAGLFI